ncbi:(d)CMP kinase [Planctomycetaceae bacterium AH-315-I19]|nr:(d)CMP kinase [Planctomycetaceae bacterium AH-315-I19]
MLETKLMTAHSNRIRRTGRVIITIDGPAGTGKSTVARELAGVLGLEFLDTGAMYRAASAIAIDQRLDMQDHEAIAQRVREADMRFDWLASPPELFAFGTSINHRLRDDDVTRRVSEISAIRQVRRELVERQRRIGEIHPRLVTEGRDQGSVVFFDADVKIYLDARPSVRAERRAEQLTREGRSIDLAELEREIIDRDAQDSSREVGPLHCPENAVRVDTSEMSQPQVVEHLAEIACARLEAVPADAAAKP